MPNDRDYEVGYGKPPVRTRFRPGQSGNPKGRPKKARSGGESFDQMFRRIANQPIRINIGGESRQVTQIEAILWSMMASALKGNGRLAQELLKILLRLQETDRAAPAEVEALPATDEAIIDRHLRHNLEALLARTRDGDTLQ